MQGSRKQIMARLAEVERQNRVMRKALKKAIPFIGYQAFVPEIVEQAEAAIARKRKAAK